MRAVTKLKYWMLLIVPNDTVQNSMMGDCDGDLPQEHVYSNAWVTLHICLHDKARNLTSKSTHSYLSVIRVAVNKCAAACVYCAFQHRQKRLVPITFPTTFGNDVHTNWAIRSGTICRSCKDSVPCDWSKSLSNPLSRRWSPERIELLYILSGHAKWIRILLTKRMTVHAIVLQNRSPAACWIGHCTCQYNPLPEQ